MEFQLIITIKNNSVTMWPVCHDSISMSYRKQQIYNEVRYHAIMKPKIMLSSVSIFTHVSGIDCTNC